MSLPGGDVACRALAFSDLSGWDRDEGLQQALAAFRATAERISGAGWDDVARMAREARDPRDFFEDHFTPVEMGPSRSAHFTGYFEPELEARRERGGGFDVPILAAPSDLAARLPLPRRAEIEAGALEAEGLEIAWLADAVDAFFLHVQGSGRLIFEDGSRARVGFAGKNGHEYTSIGRVLIERGEVPTEAMNPEAIRAYVAANGPAILQENDSYIFFRELPDPGADVGPVGALQAPLRAGRSVAVDPGFVPLGAPVWIAPETGPAPRLCIAQDIGSAIKGAQRADLFCGSGAEAGAAAGALNTGGQMVVLLPKAVATALLRSGR